MTSKKLVPINQKAVPSPAVMSSLFIGYARVSTVEQSLDMQIAALKTAGCAEIYAEKVSTRNAHRDQFSNLRKFIQPSDTLVVYAFNRLSRDLKQLLTLVDEFKAQGVKLISTSEPHIDPYTTNGRLLISVTGAVDENERGRVRDRTRDGMAELKRQGMYLGRPRKVTPEVAAQMKAMRKRKIAAPIIAKKFKLSVQSVYANT